MPFDMLIPTRRKLSTWIVSVLVGFLAFAIAAISLTLYLSWQLEGSAAAINDTGAMRMHCFRLAVLLSRGTDPDPAARAGATREIAAIAETIAKL